MEERTIDALSVVNEISAAIDTVTKYILDTDNWIFYWISNDEVRDFINEYPDDYADMARLRVTSISNGSCECEIEFIDHPNLIRKIKRYCVLLTFRDNVELNFNKSEGNLRDYKLKNLTSTLEYYRGIVRDLEEKIREEYGDDKGRVQ